MNSWTDSHAHVYLEAFLQDHDAMITRSKEQGIEKIYMPNIDVETIDAMLEMEHRYPHYCVPMMGIHPCYIKKNFEKQLYIVEKWFSKRKFAAIGEIGFDKHEGVTYWAHQQEAFRIQISWAIQYCLPIVIHCREAMAEMLDVLASYNHEKLKGVLHCFTGSVDEAKRATTMGFYIGLGGIATFKNGGMEEVIRQTDLSRILLETDSPYLAPVPHRGQRNEPAYIDFIAKRVAALKEVSLEELSASTQANARCLFAS